MASKDKFDDILDGLTPDVDNEELTKEEIASVKEDRDDVCEELRKASKKLKRAKKKGKSGKKLKRKVKKLKKKQAELEKLLRSAKNEKRDHGLWGIVIEKSLPKVIDRTGDIVVEFIRRPKGGYKNIKNKKTIDKKSDKRNGGGKNG